MAEKKRPPFATKTATKNPFTVDHEASGVVEMPTLTKLLNRKKLGLSKDTKSLKTVSGLSVAPKPLTPEQRRAAAAQAEKKPESNSDPVPATQDENTQISLVDLPASDIAPPPLLSTPNQPAAPGPATSTHEEGGISLSLSLTGAPLELEMHGGAAGPAAAGPTSPTGSEAKAAEPPQDNDEPTDGVRVQAAKPRAERRDNKLALWDLKQLKAGPDPLGKGIAVMMEKSARSALFLAIVAPPPGSPVPHFVASAAIADADRVRLWTGMKWDPTVVPELWNIFVRTGFVELSPPGTTTNIKSNRNVVRAAFGVDPGDWLLLVRAGPADTCRGVLALIANKSILTDLGPALALISAPAPTTGAAGKKAS